MRDHTKLEVFSKADQLLLATYRLTADFPKSEAFGLTSQMRRAAVSAASNIVEGCARRTEAEFLRFIDTATGSAKELGYQLDTAERLGLGRGDFVATRSLCSETVRMLVGLQNAIRLE
jgi:four helix bundle protein